jgi:Tol biopolymer transport system component
MAFNLTTHLAPVQINLTNDPGADARPTWSFDNRLLCWTSNRGGNNDIWIMNADGSDAHRLTTEPASDDFCSIK